MQRVGQKFFNFDKLKGVDIVVLVVTIRVGLIVGTTLWSSLAPGLRCRYRWQLGTPGGKEAKICSKFFPNIDRFIHPLPL